MRTVLLLGSLLVGLVACAGDRTMGEGQTPDATPTDSIPATQAALIAAADRGRMRGDTAAALWVVMASDFQCPYCRQWHAETYPSLVRDYVETGKVRIAFVNFPLNIHPNAKPTAEAAMCAAVDGKFWPVHDGIFHTQERWARMGDAMPLLDSIAAANGVAMDAWRACMRDHSTLPLVNADYDRLARSGVQSTPHFFIGDQPIVGAQPLTVFRAAIDSALARSR